MREEGIRTEPGEGWGWGWVDGGGEVSSLCLRLSVFVFAIERGEAQSMWGGTGARDVDKARSMAA